MKKESKARAGGDPHGVFVVAARVVGWKLRCSCACVELKKKRGRRKYAELSACSTP